MSLTIHENIHNKLNFFIKENKVPHIILHGPSGSGKRNILNEFINDIYENDKQKLNQYVMHVNCAHSKGIRFIRDELKFFAKTNIHNKNNNLFKSIVLFNADQLTIDAQSALRRCIEQFSHTTRFFILVNNVNRLLKPILSRFCNIYIPIPNINDSPISLYEHFKHHLSNNDFILKRKKWLRKKLETKNNFKDIKSCIALTEILYQKSFNSIDIIKTLEGPSFKKENKYLFLIYFDKIRSQFRDEQLLMLTILNLFFLRKNLNLENILEM
jgi:DNA polymerase III delta prime subunit